TRIDLVLPGILRGRAVRRLENGVAGHVVDVGAGRDTDASNLRGERIRDVVSVEIHGGDDIVFIGPREDLLQEGIGNHVFDNDAIGQLAPRTSAELFRSELPLGQLIAPIPKSALGELHDVAFVDKRDALEAPLPRMLNGRPHKTLRAFLRHRLYTDAAGLREDRKSTR